MTLLATAAAAVAFGCLGWFGGLRFERAGHTLRDLLADTRHPGATTRPRPAAELAGRLTLARAIIADFDRERAAVCQERAAVSQDYGGAAQAGVIWSARLGAALAGLVSAVDAVMAPAAGPVAVVAPADVGAVTAALQDGAELRRDRGDQATANRYRMLADALGGGGMSRSGPAASQP